MKVKFKPRKIPRLVHFLSSIILIIEALFEVLGLLADHHIFFNICQTISSTIIVVVGYFEGTSAPMDFITMALRFRWYILVVEPSPAFQQRSSAADYPLFHLYYFSTFHACPFKLRCRE
jgi:hypothetical protein